MSDCPRAGRILFGCKFRARYDEHEPSDIFAHLFHTGQAAIEALKAGAKRSTYIHDVCVRCGRVIERKKP
jgi:hypothetical protein